MDLLNNLSLASITTSKVANLILATPQQNNAIRAINKKTGSLGESFLFHYDSMNESTLSSEITDHFVEDNTAIQDNISLLPEKIVASGFISELNNVVPSSLRVLKETANKLTMISEYTPQLSVTALNAYNTAFQAYQAQRIIEDDIIPAYRNLSNEVSLVSIDGNTNSSSNPPVQNKQQRAYAQFYYYWKNRNLFTVQTPWAIFKNMAIESLKATQDETSAYVTDFTITFKIIRFAQATITNERIIQERDFQGRSKDQASPLIDKGTQKPSIVTPLPVAG